MPWTDETWSAFLDLIDGAWPGELAEHQATALRLVLDDVEPEAAARLARRFMGRQKWRPLAADFATALEAAAARPTFEEAFRALYGRPSPLDLPTTARAVEAAAALHPLIGRFVMIHGRDYLARLEVHDPEYGGAKRRALEKAWDRMVDVEGERDVAALVAGAGDRRGELVRLDPLRALGGARPELPGGDAA